MRELLAHVACPALVVRRRGDRVVLFVLGEHLTTHLPEARPVELEGRHHIPYLGNRAAIVTVVNRFLGVRPEAGARLTERECEVLRLLADGLSSREIASRLVISEATAARHVANIFAKFGVWNRAAAGAWAFHNGLI